MSREYCSTSAEYHEAVHHTAWTPKLRMSSQYMRQRERDQQDTQHSGQSQPPKEEEAEQNTRPLQPHIHAEDDIDSEPEDLKLEQQHAEFYDSGADDKDEEWMLAQRQGRHSDAILSCPGCLTTVCIDCQRHEFYTTQYRAMFVMNCRVGTSPKEAPVSGEAKLGKRQRQADTRQSSAKFRQEVVYPVYCETCDAELGVQDSDEVVHFFNTFPSTA